MRPVAPSLWPEPRLRTTADPICTLQRRRFEVVQLVPRRCRRVDAVSAQAAKFAGAIMMGVHVSRLVAVELQCSLPSSGVA